MREYFINISEPFTKGLRPYDDMPRNSPYLIEAHNVRVTERGLRIPITLTNPLLNLGISDDWPWPQIIWTSAIPWLITRTKLYKIDAESNEFFTILEVLSGLDNGSQLYHIADFYGFQVLTNGKYILYKSPLGNSWYVIDNTKVIGIPRTVLNFRGQFLLGGLGVGDEELEGGYAGLGMFRNLSDEAGDDSTGISTYIPVDIPNIAEGSSFSDGGYHSLGVKSDGICYSWGYNTNGQLGNIPVDFVPHPTPAAVKDPTGTGVLSSIIHVSAGGYHSFALSRDGKVYAWGYNTHGELGLGDTVERTLPVLVEGISDVKKISCGESHTLILKSDGTVWGCGYNSGFYSGTLGLGDAVNRLRFTRITALSNVIDIAAGYDNSIFVLANGSVWTTGKNNALSKQLGTGDDNPTGTLSPVQVYNVGGGGNIQNIYRVDTSTDFGPEATSIFCRRKTTAEGGLYSGTVFGWGNNRFGELGVNDIILKSTPVQMFTPGGGGVGISQIIDLAMGTSGFSVLTDGYYLYASGWNGEGNLGIGVFIPVNRPYPDQVLILEGTPLTANFVKVSAGYAAHALTAEGVLYGWGGNWGGQVGDGTIINRAFPVIIPGTWYVRG